MTEKERTKQIHAYLNDDQVDDYELVKKYTGITNDSDLVRYVFRQEAHRVRQRLGQVTPPKGIPIAERSLEMEVQIGEPG